MADAPVPFRVLVLNQVSASGLARLPADRYLTGKELTQPDAILLRSADLHGAEIPASVRAVARAGAGVNNIPVATLSLRGVPVFNTPGANANAVKELVLAGMLLAARHLPAALQFVQQLDTAAPDLDKRVEDGKKAFAGVELAGQTLGVVGLGKIGCLVADAAIRLGMNVLGFDPEITVDAAWSLPAQVRRANSVAEVLRGANFVTLHVPLLISHRQYNPEQHAPKRIDAQTSHIDLLPTLLAIAGADREAIERARRSLSKTHTAAPLPGADLLPLIASGGGPVLGPDGEPRRGVLFATDDMITEPLPLDDDPHNLQSQQQYAVFLAAVERLRTRPTDDATAHRYRPELRPGPVPQPAHVRALRSGAWKLVRYCDPWSALPAADQWELYHLALDPVEAINLLVYDAPFPTPIASSSLPGALTCEDVTRVAEELRTELDRQEAACLSPYPSAHPSGRA